MGQPTHLSKCALSNHLDRPKVTQTDLRPAKPQKLRLGTRMPPYFSQKTLLRYAREGPLELRTSTRTKESEPGHGGTIPHTHRTFKSIAVSSAMR